MIRARQIGFAVFVSALFAGIALIALGLGLAIGMYVEATR